MPGNKDIYNDAITKASNAAWDRQFDTAIREYQRATLEFPDDAVAHLGLASALRDCGRLEDALLEYRAVRKLRPDDPALLEQTAELCQKLGRREEAIQDRLCAAERLAARKEWTRAIEAWRHAGQLEPDQVEIREKLSAAYIESGHTRAAVKELVSVARIHERRGEPGPALAALERAVKLDPANSEAAGLLVQRRGARGAAEAPAETPVEVAARSSLSRLASTMFEATKRGATGASAAPGGIRADGLDAVLMQALDAQTRGQTDEAIALYSRLVKAGVAGPDILFNLAVLYRDALEFDEAIALFSQTVRDRQYFLPSCMALNQCYLAQGKNQAAQEILKQGIQAIEGSGVGPEQTADVVRLYESLAVSYRAQGAESDAEKCMTALSDFLKRRGWDETAGAVAPNGAPASNSQARSEEGIDEGAADRVTAALRLSGEHLHEGRLVAASEEALNAIELAPNYLPAHRQLAEILVEANRLPEARFKFEMLAETARVRNDASSAISFYRKALSLAPDDASLRGRVFEHLIGLGRLPEALDEYDHWGSVLEKNGDDRGAIELWREGLQLARRAGVATPGVSQLRERLADAHYKAHDWAEALPLLTEMRAEAPEDERCQFLLAEVCLHLGERERGEQDLDDMLSRAASAPRKTLVMLSTLAHNLPDDIGVHLRFARALARFGRRAQAVRELDALGERLLSAGQTEEAITAIREIIALDPPEVNTYRKLLGDLTAPEKNNS